MTSSTIRITCPYCGSDDCNMTSTQLGKLITVGVRETAISCNSCTYNKVSLIVHVSEICTETRLPGNEDTELKYIYTLIKNKDRR